jgi:threonine dehydratase
MASDSSFRVPVVPVVPVVPDLLRLILTSRVYDVAEETPLEPAARLSQRLGNEVLLKREDLQRVFSFKIRGAYNKMAHMTDADRRNGVIAASAGNHAACVAYAARAAGVSAQVIVPRSASPARLEICRRHGAEVILADDIQAAFAEMHRRCAGDGRVPIHSFDSAAMVLGAADLAAEFVEQVGRLDALVVAVGGGGLLAGSAAALHALAPACAVHGVEPSTADTMAHSLETGTPQPLRGTTIADSLAAPYASTRTLALCRRFSRGVVRVDDAAILGALGTLFTTLKLAVEPAAAAALAALLGPLRPLAGGAQRIGLIVCGSNIDPRTYATLLAPGVATFWDSEETPR